MQRDSASTIDLALILAAGASERMGSPKALLPLKNGATFLTHLHAQLERAGFQVLTLVGKHGSEIASAHPSLPLLVNRVWRKGQFSTVRRGLREALKLNAKHVLLHPVDAPFVNSSLLKSMKEKLDAHDAVVPTFEGAPGHPVLLTSSAARKILKMQSTPHLQAALHQLKVRLLPTEENRILWNVNTPEDLEKVLGRLEKQP